MITLFQSSRAALKETKEPSDAYVHRSVDELPEKRVIAPLKRAINGKDESAFKLSLRKFFKNESETNKLGSVLHKIRMQDLDTVMHEAARVKGATSILMFICNYAPFLMGQPNSFGQTVWHIAAQNKHSFEILYHRRQTLKKQLEEAGTPRMSIYGVEGGMEDLSIKAANRHGNTALHQALLSNNMKVAQVLFDADKELCYRVNVEKKSPMHLALENGHVDFFKSMFEFAASSSDKISDFDAQKKWLLKIAHASGHGDQIINLINGDKPNVVHAPWGKRTSRSSSNRKSSSYSDSNGQRPYDKTKKHRKGDPSDQTTVTYDFVKLLPFGRCYESVHISSMLFWLLMAFIVTSMPPLQLFYYVTIILSIMIFLGIVGLAVERHPRYNMLTDTVLFEIYLTVFTLTCTVEAWAGSVLIFTELKHVTIGFTSLNRPIIISYKGVPFFILRQ